MDSDKTRGNVKKWLGGDNNVICDVCGKKKKRSQCVMAYGSGMIPVVMSCRDGCADYNHPLNYPPPIIFDGRPVQDARPEQTNTFVQVSFSQERWGSFFPKTVWSAFNAPNNEFNLNGIWTWGSFNP